MDALLYLFFTKIKATIRNIFSNAVSGIITFLGIILFGVTLWAVVFLTDHSLEMGGMINIQSIHVLVTTYIGVIFFFMGFMLFQKRTALMYKNDAYYIFSGPFGRKTILTYINFDNAKGGLLYALFATWYVAMFAAGTEGVTPVFLLFILLHSILMLFAILSLITYFYLLEITDKNARKIKWGIVIVAIIYIVALFAKSFLANPSNINVALSNFVADPLFYFIPLFGFAKYGLIEYVSGNTFGLVLSFVLNLAICLLLSYMISTIHGQFVEQVLEDADWAESVRKQARAGKTRKEMDGKVHEVKNVEMKSGAGAISSKIMLELTKTRSFIRLQEAGLMLFYLGIAYFIGMDFTFYQYYILIILLASASNDYIVTELKKPYIYLIPDKASKKMLHLLTPMAMKMILVVIFGLSCGYLVFRPSLTAFVSAIFSISSYGIMFTAGSIWSLRLMKSGNNAMAEQFVKMGVILLASLPAIVVSVLLVIYMGETLSQDALMAFISVASVVSNILVGALLIVLSSSMLNGAEVMAD